jgi:DNA adenine methylase
VADLASRLPAAINTYVEPFAGSACLAFSIDPKRRVLGDLNPRLIEFYEALRDAPGALHAQYRSIEATPTAYYQTRALFNSGAPSATRAAQFLYLNRNCFNGIYRVNMKGEFNVPWGGDKVGKPLTLENLQAASRVLIDSKLVCGDFEALVDGALDPNAFFYLDPPYAHDETRVFREYHHDSFATRDWDRLLATLERIDRAGARFLLSYAGDPSLIKRVGRWNVGHLDVTRNVGGFKASRRKHREFIATNYELRP